MAHDLLHRGLLLALGLVLAGAPLLWLSGPAVADTASSARTVRAASYDPLAAEAPFPDLAVTVSQTTDLIQQGVTVSWTGGVKSEVPNQQSGGQNFLQILQCWGDEPGSKGTRPDRTTCQYGGFNQPGNSRWSNRSSGEPIAAADEQYTAPGADVFEPTMTAIPFRSATGVSVASIVDGQRVAKAPDLNNNEFFTRHTTNEIAWAGFGADGSGSVTFELQTLQQSPGLGCGAEVAGREAGASCWLVVVPRGTNDEGRSGITASGLFWATWQHHLAVKLEFKRAGLQCALGAAERQVSGSELLAGAMGQWQPALCSSPKGAVYSLLTGPESDAVAAAASATDTAPLALTSRASTEADDPLVYAPVALTGITVGFAIDRQVDGGAPRELRDKERLALSSLKLTPRLVAKLLTSSYRSALPIGADVSHLLSNPNILTQDPEFLQVNDPEWKHMNFGDSSVGLSDLLVPLGRSDSAYAVWEYVMADPQAADFLMGVPDEWGARVNKYYSTNARVNPSGTGLTLPRSDFPKADPSEFPGFANNGNADVVNPMTWRPYTSGLENAGYRLLRGDAMVLGGWDATAVPPKYQAAPRDLVGLQKVIGLTSGAAAARYEVAQVALRNPAGKFVLPSVASYTAAAAAMTPVRKSSTVLRFEQDSDKASAARAAYPLTVGIYAAANPTLGDAAVRADYAQFIRFAAGQGQRVGTGDGQLPAGYAPLPGKWREVARAAAKQLTAAKATPAPTSTPASPTPSRSSAPAVVPAPVPPAAPSAPATASPSPSPSSSVILPPATPADPVTSPLVLAVPGAAALGATAALMLPLVGRFRRGRS